MNITVPGSSAFKPASTSAAAISIAVCASWPQACITSTSFPRYCCFAFEAKGRSAEFLHRKRIHVCTQRHRAPRLSPFENADDTGARDAGADFESKAAQVLCDELRGPRFLIAEFRVLVNVAPPRNQLRFDNRRPFADFGFERAALRLCFAAAGGGRAEDERDDCEEGCVPHDVERMTDVPAHGSSVR